MSEKLPVKPWYVYIVETLCGKFYTGITVDVARRFQEHCDVHKGVSTKGAKYFRGHEPKRLVWIETCSSRSEACKRELEIKAMSRQSKIKLFSGVEQRFNKGA